MDTTTINQLIESGGILFTAVVALYFWKYATGIRRDVARESGLLRDCLFFRYVIDKYQVEIQELTGKKKTRIIREQVQAELDYKPSRFSQPSAISDRLEVLQSRDASIGEFLSRIEI